MKGQMLLIAIFAVCHCAAFGQNGKTQAYLGIKDGGE